ncbi:hypothetical protein DM02DRAFT_596251 [Periconia macrospinosa]|uniref:Uncharacterized protein n=1 Tax=Periconia macrospinosa TaxID=97972 RepID=A0A2V1DJM0_9PLEO|nr:hypothetical protein DM02DRAFT_596251 [Periconia macrospinosa]
MDPVQLRGSVDNDIYLGIWTDQSLGKVLGTTLTLDRQSGSIFIAMLALYITAAGRGFWRICRYFLHLYLSRNDNIDGVYHQRQTILRNLEVGLDSTLELLCVGYGWRGRAKKSWRRVLPVAAIALFIYVVFVAAGIFSSKWIDRSMMQGNEVLIAGRDCGKLDSGTTFSNQFSFDRDPVQTAALAQGSIDALSRAATCYRSQNATELRDCRTFTHMRLPYRADNDSMCPFGAPVCKMESGNIRFDTGRLDSLEHLGINKGPRFHLRHQASCAPLKTEGYSEVVDDIRGNGGKYIGFNYWMNVQTKNAANINHALFVPYSNSTERDTSRGNYQVTPLQWTYVKKANYSIITELDNPTALLSLMFVEKSQISTRYNSTDPWLGMTKRAGPRSALYLAEEPINVLGCFTTRTFCLPTTSSDSCMTWHSPDNATEMAKLWPSESDRALLRPLFALLAYGDAGSLDSFFSNSNTPNLLARNTLSGSRQMVRLPPNWWQHELEYLFQGSLAATQRAVVAYARGEPWTKSAAALAGGEDNEVLCHSQKIRSLEHYSFAVIDIAFVFVVGLIFISLSLFLDRLIDVAPRIITPLSHNQKFMYARAEWQAGSTLQIQRMAHENLGMGTWSRANQGVPVTEKGDRIAVLDVRDEMHPRMMRPDIRPKESPGVTPDSSVRAMSKGERASMVDEWRKGRKSFHGF